MSIKICPICKHALADNPDPSNGKEYKCLYCDKELFCFESEPIGCRTAIKSPIEEAYWNAEGHRYVKEGFSTFAPSCNSASATIKES